MNSIRSVLLLLVTTTTILGQPQEKLSVALKELQVAPTEGAIEGKSLSISVLVWRDFQPGAGFDGSSMIGGSPMLAGVRLAMSDKSSIPVGIKLDRIWVIYGDQAWEASNFRGQQKGAPPDKEGWINCSNLTLCEVTARNGPKWGPDVYVDVVVRLTDKDGRHYLIRVPKQLMISTH